MIPISLRLKQVAEYVPEGEILVDIGTDHAYLPIYLVKENKIKKAIAGEVNEGPYTRALAHVDQQNLSNLISVRLGNGLDVLEKDEATVLTIAGMGGSLMTDILDADIEKLASIKRAIFQPMNGEFALRSWLIKHKYAIIDETMVKEQDTIYEIIIVEPSNENQILSDIELQFGPILMRKKCNWFLEKWKLELEKKEKILTTLLNKGSISSIEQKKQVLLEEIQVIKELITK